MAPSSSAGTRWTPAFRRILLAWDTQALSRAERPDGGDRHDGWFVNANLAEYHAPTHADNSAIDAVFFGERDAHSSAMKSAGLGELGICGAARLSPTRFTMRRGCVSAILLTLDTVLNGWSGETIQQRSSVEPAAQPG